MAKLAALIAAAGNSSRMGSHKALLHFRGQSLLTYSAEQFLSVTKLVLTTLPPTLVASIALNPDAPPIKKICNNYPDLGYFGSIKSAVLQCMDTTDGLFITPVDAPVIDRALILAMASMAKHACSQIIVPYFHHRAGHPVYISRHFFDDLLHFAGGFGLQEFIAQRKDNERAIFWPNQQILANLNQPANLPAALHVRDKKPSCKIGDAAAIEAPRGNCSTPRRRRTISRAPSTPIRSISST